MKSLTRFLVAFFSLTPCAFAAPVSQPAGSNLTQYNGNMGSVAGNQWNAMMNERNNIQSNTPKADYGNCNSIVLRCAKPKCAGGGCASMDVARSIAQGCVGANATCKKHGNDFIEYVAGQLMSESMAAQQQAQAAAAAASSEQSAQQIAAMQQQMQAQMAQMQEQSNAQIASLQSALQESQRASEAAAAAATAAAVQSATAASPDTGLTPTQEAAAKSGVDPETIQRATITGQILSSMEGVDSALAKLKTTMRDAFRYGKCNEINGDNCEGPKRIKKFRDLASKFFEPYDALEDNLEEALAKAQSVGVDMGNIYMFFSGSCNRWAEFVCRDNYSGGLPVYGMKCKQECGAKEMQTSVGIGYVKDKNNCVIKCDKDEGGGAAYPCMPDNDGTYRSQKSGALRGGHECYVGQTVPPEDLKACSINKYLDQNSEDITDRVLNPDTSDNGTIRVGCATDVSTSLIRRRKSSSKGKSGIDIDLLSYMIAQSEGGAKFGRNGDDYKNCGVADNELLSGCFCGTANQNASQALTVLRAATVSKTLTINGGGACCSEPGKGCDQSCYNLDLDISYVNPVFALCDTYAWNAGVGDNDAVNKGEEKERAKEIVGLKTTVIAQQMYKQYTTLEKMIKQVKIMLEKEVLKAQLQVAGGTSSGSGGDSGDDGLEFATCSSGDDTEIMNCLNSNLVKYEPFATKGNRKSNVMKAMKKDCDRLERMMKNGKNHASCSINKLCSERMSTKEMQDCYEALQDDIRNLGKNIKYEEKENSGGKTIKLQLD